MPSSWFITDWLLVLISSEILFVTPQLAMNTGFLKGEGEWLHSLPLFLLASSMSQILQQTIHYAWLEENHPNKTNQGASPCESGELREGQAA